MTDNDKENTNPEEFLREVGKGWGNSCWPMPGASQEWKYYDFGYRQAVRFTVSPLLSFSASISSECLKKPATVFADNVLSLHRLGLFPAFIFDVAPIVKNVIQKSIDEIQATRTNDYTVSREGGGWNELQEKAKPEIENAVKNALAEGQLTRDGMTDFCLMLSSGGPVGTYDAVRAVLGCLITGIWTAFESLAADVWEASLNANPQLGFLALNAEIKLGDEPAENARKRKVKFQVPIHLLEKYEYNVKHRMGSLLRDKWDFARKSDAKEAYEKAFGKDKESQIGAIFEDQNLRWLAATRNNLVHCAGRADNEFNLLTKAHPVFAGVLAGEQIPLNGDTVRPLVASAVFKGMELVRLVDERLKSMK